MTWLERMNNAMDYIEYNLEGTVDLSCAAQIACCSVSGFQKVFSIITNTTVAEYVRRRRLTLAAFALQNSKIKVVDLALQYGYESPEAFARAFHAVHGTTPSSARNEGVRLKAYPRISFLLTVKGEIAMDYRIETKEAFTVYGIEEIFTTENGEHMREVPQFWLAAINDGRYDALVKSTGLPGHDDNGLCAVNSVCDYREMEGSKFPYMLFAFVSDKSDNENFTTVKVPAATWAVFRSEQHICEETSDIIQNLIKRVYTDWLPTAGYEKIDGYELEMYYGQGDTCYTETWIRVVPK